MKYDGVRENSLAVQGSGLCTFTAEDVGGELNPAGFKAQPKEKKCNIYANMSSVHKVQ